MSVGETSDAAARPRELGSCVGAAAAALGLLAAVALDGWLTDLDRFAAARLPAGPAAGALGLGRWFADGLRALVPMAALFTASCALAWFSSRRRWERHGQDWHDIVRYRGVAGARRVRATLGVAPLPPGPAPLGEGAVRLVAGFNIMILSALLAVGAARVVGAVVPVARWALVLIVGGGVFLLARWALTLVGPLVLHPRLHGLTWGLLAAGTLFASAPVGVPVLIGVAIATLGRRLARVPRPESAPAALRSPLPWLLLAVCGLLGLADAAQPPVSFPRAALTTAAGARLLGGYLTRAGDGVYVVTCIPLADATSTRERLRLLPIRGLRSVRLGGGEAYLDSGARPSLGALALHAVGIGATPPTLFNATFRAPRPTCAGADPPALSAGTEDPALGPGVIAGPPPGRPRALDGEAPVADTDPPAIARLAKAYQPTLLVDVADRNWPVSLGAVLAERGPGEQPACLIQARAPRRVCPATATSLAGAAGGGSVATDYLQLPVELAADHSPSGQFQAFLRGQYLDSGPRREWLADPGVLHPWDTAQLYFLYAGPLAATAFPRRYPTVALDPNVPGGLIALEYWFYYPFNYYPLVADADLMTQAPIAGDGFNVDLHQGDWEHVDVLLDPRTLKPAWLYMARHSYEGRFVPWDSPALRFDGTHPLLQAAYGGHPTYLPGCGARPRPVTHDLSADWLSCGSGRFAFRGATTPLVDLARQPWACWRGHFGEARTGLELANAKRRENALDGARRFVFVAGPGAPLRQAENAGFCRGQTPAIRSLSVALGRIAAAESSGSGR